jgi:hypothetical protein
MSDELNWLDVEQKMESADRRYFPPIRLDTDQYDD